MLNLYLAPSSSSSRRAKKWLIDHGIEFTERDISKDPLTADDIKRLLRLSENGQKISSRLDASATASSKSTLII